MDIRLTKDGKERVYTAPFLSMRTLMEATKVAEKINSQDMNAKDLETLADFAVKNFGDQFTREEVIDGLALDEAADTLTRHLQAVLAGVTQVIGVLNDPNALNLAVEKKRQEAELSASS